METLQGFFGEFFNEFLATLAMAAVAALYLKFRSFVEKQKKRDEEQDRLHAQWRSDFERKLKDRNIRHDYFERQRLIAFRQIRRFAQKARDEARKIESPDWIEDHGAWSDEILTDYNQILELLHEHALLLEHFGHYEVVHTFKNVLLNFYIASRKKVQSNDKDRKVLVKEYGKLAKSFEALIAEIRYPIEKDELESLPK